MAAKVSRVQNFPGLAKLEAAAYEGKTAVVQHEAYTIRRVWHEGEWYFSVADVAAALSESKGERASTYWRTTKVRLKKEMETNWLQSVAS